jgi:peptidoglycan/xylan/chitin deacetylase (PgdA/CDA1 family)
VTTSPRVETTHLLMLHRVMADHATAFGRPSCYRLRGTALTPDEFDRVLDAEPFLSLEEVTDAIARDKTPPPGWVLTFDDGYREWIDLVAPRLEARRIHAAFFFCPAFLSTVAEAHPVDGYYWLLDHARRPRFALRLPDGTEVEGSLESDEAKNSLVRGPLKQFIVKGPRAQVREVLTRLAEVLGVTLDGKLPRKLHPSEQEVQALARAGHTLGGHGWSHRHLTAMSQEESTWEIGASLEWAARVSGRRAIPFAYPDGAFDERTALQVERAGATCALTCVRGDVSRQSLRFQLPRDFTTSRHALIVRGESRVGGA